MLFALMCEDRENSLAARLQARPAHLERLHALQKEGRLVLAGPFPAIAAQQPGEAGFTGSLIVAEFASQTEAEAWAAADPYQAAGVYQQITIKPFKAVLP